MNEMKKNKLRIALLLLIISLPLLAPQCPTIRSDFTKKIKPIDQQLEVYEAEIAKHEKVAQGLRAEKALAYKENRKPDPSTWEALATAGGYRSEAYHKSPPEIKKIIDEFESVNAQNVVQGTLLGLSGGNPWARFNIEITRSDTMVRILKKEVARLKKERAKVQAELDEFDRARKKRRQSSEKEEEGNGNGGY